MVINVLTVVMIGVAVASVLTSLEFAQPSSCAVDVLTDDWDEAFIGIDLSIDMRVDELIDMFANMGVDVMTALNFSMPPSSEERLCLC